MRGVPMWELGLARDWVDRQPAGEPNRDDRQIQLERHVEEDQNFRHDQFVKAHLGLEQTRDQQQQSLQVYHLHKSEV